MSYRWLKFWGDLREGIHTSWLDNIDTQEHASELAYRHEATASALRISLGVAVRWDARVSPDDTKWVTLEEREFDRWCEAVGLLTLGDHLKRVLSVRAVERLKVSLDRPTLAAIMQFINSHRPASNGPLPLHIPTAREMGVRAIAVTCANQAPALWSRLRLRVEKSFYDASTITSDTLVHLPTLEELTLLDTELFDSNKRRHLLAPSSESHDTWTQTQTLSA